VVKKSDTL